MAKRSAPAPPTWWGSGSPTSVRRQSSGIHNRCAYGNAIVWQDTRTDKIAAALGARRPGRCHPASGGLPPATYFSGGKLQWILENVDGVREAAERGRALFGTTDSWLLWNLTGGVDGGQHITRASPTPAAPC